MSDDTRDTPSRSARRQDPSADDALDRTEDDFTTESDIEEAPEPMLTHPDRDAEAVHDDQARETEGIHEMPSMDALEGAARRDDVIRSVDDAILVAQTWAEQSDDEDAEEILDLLVEASDRLGRTLDDSDPERDRDLRRGEREGR